MGEIIYKSVFKCSDDINKTYLLRCLEETNFATIATFGYESFTIFFLSDSVRFERTLLQGSDPPLHMIKASTH